jgi:voltage-gated potassium channel
MNSKVEAVVVILTAVSVIIIVFDIIFDPSGTVLTFIYSFDLGVVVILAIDFYFRAKESSNKRRFILTHCYEIPALIPLIFFGLIESNHVFDFALRSLRLVRLFRLIILFSRSSLSVVGAK